MTFYYEKLTPSICEESQCSELHPTPRQIIYAWNLLERGMADIEHFQVCKDGGHVKIGDRLVAEARYDPQLHPLIMHQGKPDPVMGSMGVYIGIDS